MRHSIVRRFMPVFLVLALKLNWCPAQEYEFYDELPITEKDRKHWAFKPIEKPQVPAVLNKDWPRTPLDYFILAQLEQAGLAPAPKADRLTLIRRLYYDLLGLPPEKEEIEAFLNDTSDRAYEKVVDQVLHSKHYGERWAQHWLDVVRFAESNGFEVDAERPFAWRYRDYVVRSFNADKPYSQFLREQIAGDLLWKPPLTEKNQDYLIAPGMHRCGPIEIVSGNIDLATQRQAVMTEMVNGLGSAVLGLTLACCRCHDHKFDPLSQGDYYRLQAFFSEVVYKDYAQAKPEQVEKYQQQLAEINNKLGPIKKQIAALEAPYRQMILAERRQKLSRETLDALATEKSQRTEAQKKLVIEATPFLKILWDEVLERLSETDRQRRTRLQEELLHWERQKPPPLPEIWSIAATLTGHKTHILKRGDASKKLDAVTPDFIRILKPLARNGGSSQQNSAKSKTRLDWVEALISDKHPLTSRVIMNRLWQHHFGRGLVSTPNDFGLRGARPTHPQLLDYLAWELMHPQDKAAKSWTLKRMHKMIVLSATYQQRSDLPATAPARTIDPENRLLSRMNRRKLEAEAIRDAMLAASGRLNRALGGPSVKVPLEKEIYDLIFTEGEPFNLWPVTLDTQQHQRRSLYLFAKRNVRQPFLEAFDQPDRLNSCAVRDRSIFAPQALILMNGPWALAEAKALAERFRDTPDEKFLETLYWRTLQRPIRSDEKKLMLDFLQKQTELLQKQKHDHPRDAARADCCRAMFNLNEFIFVK